jgi:hypothetical protein
MKKVKLTESQLINLIKKVIRETEEDTSETAGCHINCMPTTVSRGDLSQTARANCCKTRKKDSEYCRLYITKYKPELKKCQTISFVQ